MSFEMGSYSINQNVEGVWGGGRRRAVAKKLEVASCCPETSFNITLEDVNALLARSLQPGAALGPLARHVLRIEPAAVEVMRDYTGERGLEWIEDAEPDGRSAR